MATKAEQELIDQLDSEERLQPGTEGWWKVWGAMPYQVQKGDIIVTLGKESEDLLYDEVAEVDKSNVVWTRFTKPDGTTFTMGNLFRNFHTFRRGTHNTLA